MAVIDKFEVTIDVGGQTAIEYDDEDLNSSILESTIPTVAKYIQSESGQSFGVHMRLEEGYQFTTHVNGLAWEISIDGDYACGRVTKSHYYETAGTWSKSRHSIFSCQDGHWVAQPFVFRDIDTRQDKVKGNSSSSKATYQEMGTIELRVQPFHITGPEAKSNPRESKWSAIDAIPEKALKGRAVTIGAGLGGARPVKTPRRTPGHVIDREGYARFIFHYRTKKSLQDLMVIPKDDLENLSAPELRAMLREQMANQITVKPESKPQPVPKREFIVDPIDDDILEIREVKRAKSYNVEVIEIDSD